MAFLYIFPIEVLVLNAECIFGYCQTCSNFTEFMTDRSEAELVN